MSDQQAYECFCSRSYKSKMSVYGHLRTKHSMIFHLNDSNAFSLIISGGKRIFKLEKDACILQRTEAKQDNSIKQEQEFSNRMIDQNRQRSAKRHTASHVHQPKIPKLSKTLVKQVKEVKPVSLFDCIKEEQDQQINETKKKRLEPQIRSNTYRFEFVQEKKSIRQALNQYVDLMKILDQQNYVDGKMIVFLLIKCVDLNPQKMEASERKTPLIPYCQNHEPKYISRIYNYFICQFIPQVVTKKQNPLSSMIRHNKILKKKQLINFLWKLHQWLRLKNYTRQQLKLEQQYKKTFLFD